RRRGRGRRSPEIPRLRSGPVRAIIRFTPKSLSGGEQPVSTPDNQGRHDRPAPTIAPAPTEDGVPIPWPSTQASTGGRPFHQPTPGGGADGLQEERPELPGYEILGLL